MHRKPVGPPTPRPLLSLTDTLRPVLDFASQGPQSLHNGATLPVSAPGLLPVLLTVSIIRKARV